MRFTKLSASGHRMRIVACLMLPLAVVNGWPVMGCICADGHYEAACQQMHGQHSPAVEAEMDSCCCCEPAEPAESEPNCCVAGANKPAPESDDSGQLGDQGRCCRAVVAQRPVPPEGHSVSFDDGHDTPAYSDACPELSEHVASCLEIVDDASRPPDDLLTTLCHLLI